MSKPSITNCPNTFFMKVHSFNCIFSSLSCFACVQIRHNPLSGGYCGEVPPLPIPNREVKLTCADGTAMQCGRVGSRLLSISEASITKVVGAFLFSCSFLSYRSAFSHSSSQLLLPFYSFTFLPFIVPFTFLPFYFLPLYIFLSKIMVNLL